MLNILDLKINLIKLSLVLIADKTTLTVFKIIFFKRVSGF